MCCDLASLHVHGTQSAIRTPPKARQRCNPPQSAMRKVKHRFRRANLELHGPKSGLRMRPHSSRGVHSPPLLAPIPNLPTKAGLDG
eukprot:15459856-Alexandrium_andersonii.AAC.1